MKEQEDYIDKVTDASEEELKKTVSKFTNNWEFIFQPSEGYIYVSDGCRYVSGYSKNDFLSNANLLEEITVNRDKNKFQDFIKQVQPESSESIIEIRILTKESIEKCLEISVRPIFENNSFLGFLGNVHDISKRKEAEFTNLLLLDEIRGIQELFDKGNVIIFKWEHKTGRPISYVSNNCSNIIGHATSELLSTNFNYTKLIHPNDLKQVETQISDIIDQKLDSFSLKPYRITTKTQQFIWVMEQTKIVYKHDEVDYFIGYIVDVSGQIESKKQILESEHNFKNFFHSSANFHLILDTNWNILELNETIVEKLKYQREFLLGQSIHFLFPIERYREAAEIFSRILKGDLQSCSIPYLTKDKKYVPVETIVHKSAWNGKEALFVSGRDLSGISISKEKVKKAFQRNSSISFICDNELEVITEVNHSFIDRLGHRPEEVLGKHITEILVDGIDQSTLSDHAAEDKPWIEDAAMLKSDGTKIPVLLSFDVFGDNNKNYVLISAIDISRSKQSVEESQNRQEELEKLLHIKGAALQETVKELVNSENTYRGIIENMQDVFYRTNTSGDLIMISPSAKDLFGYEEPEILIGENFADVFYVSPEEYLLHLDKITTEGKINNIEIQVKKQNGDIITVLANSQYYFDNNGDKIGVEGVLKDITNRKQIELALRESEEKYRNLVEKSQDAIYLAYDKHFLHINPKFEQLFGYNFTDIKQGEFDIIEIVAPKSREYVEHRNKQKDQGQYLQATYEFTALNKDSEEIEIEASVSYLPHKDGFATQGILRDVTKRKRNEQNLKKITERFSLATESAEIGVWEIDTTEKKLHWDLQMYHLYGCDPELYDNAFEVMMEHIHPDDLEQTFESIERLIQQQDRIQIDYRVITPKKEVHYLKTYAKVSRNNNGIAERVTGIAYDISETKQYEQALKNAETRYKTVADFTFDWETWYSAEGELLYCSPSCIRICGYTRDEFLNNANLLIEITHPDDKKIVQRHFQNIQSQDTDTRYSIEFRLIHKMGSTVWVGHDVQQVFDTEGKYLGIRGSSRDITKQKQNISKLKVKTKQLSTLNEISAEFAGISTELEVNAYMFSKFSDLTDCFISTFSVFNENSFTIKNVSRLDNDLRKKLTALNRPIIGLNYKLPRHHLMLLKNQDYIVIDLLDEILKSNLVDTQSILLTNRLLNHGQLYLFPIYHIDELRGIYSLSLSKGQTIQSSTLEILTGFINQASTVLQRLYANDRLLQSLKEWQAFIANANTPIIGVNSIGKITEWNRAAEQTTGFIREEVVNKDLVEYIVHPDFKDSVKYILSQALRGIETSSFEFPIITDSKKQIIFLMNITPRRNMNGAITGAIGVGQDITEIDYLRTELQNERTSLAKRVEERTAELSLANARLAKAAKLKDEFLASMSHELRTPLNAILGLSESLQEGIYGELSNKQVQKVTDIEESGRHLLSLINEILDLAKIEAGKISLEYSVVDIEQLCQASLRFIKQAAFKKNIKVNLSNSCPENSFHADEKRMKQVLVNLLSNAVKFTPEGGEIGLNVQFITDEKMQFEIWDSGIGIAKESFHKLFKPFEQIDSKLSRNFEGTGLGLALVKKLITLHNGSVSVESEVGKGSKFTLSLPIHTKEKYKTNTEISNEPQKTEEIEKDNNETTHTILLAEDNEFNITTLTEYLMAKNFNVKLATNGIEAIEHTEAIIPALIIMDIQMPKMDGLEATQQIRSHKNPDIAKIPIIALTALAMPGDRERCISAGANEYMQKPVSLKKLTELINKFLTTKN